ncbi:DUF1453 domain-containing protein [Frateuria aurantia]
MPQQQHLVGAAITVVVIALLLYRRLRSHFGRQPVKLGRMRARIVIMTCVAALFAVNSISMPHLLAGLMAGLVGGGLMALVGLRLTRYERAPDAMYYIPNPWIGGVLTLLLVGRLVWRLLIAVPAAVQHAPPAHGPVLGNSPLTLAVFGLTLGYYAVYYFGIVRRSGQILPLGPEPI